MIRFTIFGEPALLRRFMGKVSPEPMSGCWLWTGAPSDDTPTGQYGRFRVHGVQERAHRVSWLLHKGDIPDGLHVLHRCDNPACVRPDHLFLGTNQDNVADRVAKGRSANMPHPGEAHPMRKLDEASIRSIRELYRAGERQSDLARAFGIDRSTVCEIVNRRKWRHVQ